MRIWSALLAAGLLSGCSLRPEEPPTMESSGPKHPVTEKMRTVTEKLALQPAPDFSAPDAKGVVRRLDDWLKAGPVVLYAIKDGCPCSTDFEPFANDFAKRYAGKAAVVGIFNETPGKAEAWMRDHTVKHPVVLDPKQVIVRKYKQERSVYVAIVNQKKEIVRSWPGYSVEMLLELDKILQNLTGAVPAEPFDPKYAPEVPASGCQLFEGEGFAPGDVR